jgi:PAS domain S-box-containing protein
MDDVTGFHAGWRDLAGALQGGVGIHADGGFVHVSADLAAAVGADPERLVGEHWRDLFAPATADRLERSAVPRARDGGCWSGEVRLEGGPAVDLTLTTTGSGALVWRVTGHDDAGTATGHGGSTGTATNGSGEAVDGRSAPATNGGGPSATGAVGVDPEDRRRDLRADGPPVGNVVDALDDALYVVDDSGTLVYWNAELRDRFGYDDAELRDLDPADFLAPPDTDEVPDDPAAFVDVPDRYNVATLATKGGDPVPHELFGTTYADEATGERYRVGLARDISDRLERQRELERQRDELATLDRINRLLLETVRELVRTASRDAVERAVCERLAASDLYRFAWVGEREFEGDAVVPRASAGDDRGYLDAVTVDGDGTDPVARALRTGEVQVAAVDDGPPAPWREAARERGFASVAGVPLRGDDAVHGVLAVHATREDAFTPREQAGFEVVGRTVGAVIEAAQNRDLLFTDAVVELEFRVGDADTALVRAVADLGCELALDGYVAATDGWVLYVTVEGAAPEAVVAAVADDDRVDRARVVTGGEGGRVELLVTESSLLHAVTDAGTTLQHAVATPDGSDLVVEAPLDADVRGIVDDIRDTFVDVTFVARRERDRETTAIGRPGGLLGDLTDRQREVVEAAYRAGYFDWPRESTAEEVAGSLGLAGPTLHGHLRKAEATILSALLDE